MTPFHHLRRPCYATTGASASGSESPSPRRGRMRGPSGEKRAMHRRGGMSQLCVTPAMVPRFTQGEQIRRSGVLPAKGLVPFPRRGGGRGRGLAGADNVRGRLRISSRGAVDACMFAWYSQSTHHPVYWRGEATRLDAYCLGFIVEDTGCTALRAAIPLISRIWSGAHAVGMR